MKYEKSLDGKPFLLLKGVAQRIAKGIGITINFAISPNCVSLSQAQLRVFSSLKKSLVLFVKVRLAFFTLYFFFQKNLGAILQKFYFLDKN